MHARLMTALIVAGGLLPSAVRAQDVEDKYHVTATEKAACTKDAIRLCFGTYPDEDKLIACMRVNHSSLTPTCRVAFDAGMRRRHM